MATELSWDNRLSSGSTRRRGRGHVARGPRKPTSRSGEIARCLVFVDCEMKGIIDPRPHSSNLTACRRRHCEESKLKMSTDRSYTMSRLFCTRVPRSPPWSHGQSQGFKSRHVFFFFLFPEAPTNCRKHSRVWAQFDASQRGKKEC